MKPVSKLPLFLRTNKILGRERMGLDLNLGGTLGCKTQASSLPIYIDGLYRASQWGYKVLSDSGFTGKCFSFPINMFLIPSVSSNGGHGTGIPGEGSCRTKVFLWEIILWG